jgi:hypothetical protein
MLQSKRKGEGERKRKREGSTTVGGAEGVAPSSASSPHPKVKAGGALGGLGYTAGFLFLSEGLCFFGRVLL